MRNVFEKAPKSVNFNEIWLWNKLKITNRADALGLGYYRKSYSNIQILWNP